MRASFMDKFKRGAGASRQELHSLEHVIQNLVAVLNTKEGYGYFLRGFGLGGYTEKAGTREIVAALTGEIKNEIRTHEPRIEDARLTLLGRDADLQLLYDLDGTVNGEPCRLRIRFDTTSGQVRVEERPRP